MGVNVEKNWNRRWLVMGALSVVVCLGLPIDDPRGLPGGLPLDDPRGLPRGLPLDDPITPTHRCANKQVACKECDRCKATNPAVCTDRTWVAIRALFFGT